MQISSLTFLFKLSWGWQKGSQSDLSLQRQFGEAQLGGTFEGCDFHKCWASPMFQADALPVDSSRVLRIISHLWKWKAVKAGNPVHSHLSAEGRTILTLDSATHVYVDRATWPVLSGSQHLHLGNPYSSPVLSVLLCVERGGKTRSLG